MKSRRRHRNSFTFREHIFDSRNDSRRRFLKFNDFTLVHLLEQYTSSNLFADRWFSSISIHCHNDLIVISAVHMEFWLLFTPTASVNKQTKRFGCFAIKSSMSRRARFKPLLPLKYMFDTTRYPFMLKFLFCPFSLANPTCTIRNKCRRFNSEFFVLPAMPLHPLPDLNPESAPPNTVVFANNSALASRLEYRGFWHF